MQTKVRNQLTKIVPPGAKQSALYLLFRAYGRLARTRPPYDNLFLLSHMRAGSSLLAMVLGNSSEICGYGETMLTYQRAADLELLAGNNLFRLQPLSLPGNERYMLDKLVHDDLLAPGTVPELAANDVKLIFLIREPAGTISSMVNMAKLDDTLAASIYIKRLETLKQYGQALPDKGSAFLLSYADLIERTDKTLAALSSFLALQAPLRADYEVLRPMRRRDSAHYVKLHLGRVDGHLPASPQVPISGRNLRVAEDAYDRCWVVLSEVCETAVEPGQMSAG